MFFLLEMIKMKIKISWKLIKLDLISILISKSKINDIGKYSVIKNINSKENTKNKSILQSYNNNRTFVIKDNSEIDIFKKNNDDNQLIKIMKLFSKIVKIKI